MAESTEGYTHIEEAVAKWGRYRSWWYAEVKEGRLHGYTIAGLRGTYLRDEEVTAHLAPRLKESGADDGQGQAG
jgi:hypothetical protein